MSRAAGNIFAFADQAGEVAALGWSASEFLAELRVAELWKHAQRFSSATPGLSRGSRACCSRDIIRLGAQVRRYASSAKEVFNHKIGLSAELGFPNPRASGSAHRHLPYLERLRRLVRS